MGSEKAPVCLYMESNTIVEYSDVNINKNRMGFHGYGDVYSFFKVVMACVRDQGVLYMESSIIKQDQGVNRGRVE